MKPLLRFLLGRTVPIALLSTSVCFAQILSPNRAAAQNPNTREVQAHYGRLPLTFEANRGQTDAHVKFLAHGAGYTVFLTSGQMVLALRPTANTPQTTNADNAAGRNTKNAPVHSAVAAHSQKTGPAAIQINLVGADKNAAVAGEDLQPGRVNYFIGNDPKRWQTNVSTYKQVRYKNLYPGIDLIYYGNQSRVEHDFIVAPGADPDQIQLDVKGIDHLSVASNGDLILKKGNDEIRLQAPLLYQEFHGMRIPLAGQYSVKNSSRVSFKIGQYDKTLPLVIDPVLVYGTFLGGSADDTAVAIAVDSTGSAYVAGYTASTNFPGAWENSPAPSGMNAFVAKLDVSGSSLVYADYIGGSSNDYAYGMALDASSEVFITGSTSSGDFPTVNPYQAVNTGGEAAFVTGITPDGSALIFSTYLGGSDYTQGNAIGLDELGDIYVGGSTYALDFPTANAYQSTVSPNQVGSYGQYGFLTKFTPGGSALVYSTYFAGSTNVAGGCETPCWPSPFSSVSSVAVDGIGNAYLTGGTNTYNFPTTAAAYQPTNSTSGNEDVGFVSKFNSSGNLMYSGYYGATSTNYDYVNPAAIAIDSTGSAYVVGYAAWWDNPLPVTTPNLCDPAQGNGCDPGFISKFDPTGAAIMYSTYLAPSSINAIPWSVAVDANGDAYVYSQSFGGSTNFLVNPIEPYTNGADVFVQEIDSTGGTQLFSTFVGGSEDEYPGGIAVDATGNIYIAGYTESPDYPVTSAAMQNTLGGGYDLFVSKIGSEMAAAVSIYPSSMQFQSLPVGSTSQPQTSSLRNVGSAPLTIASIKTTGDFYETDTCGSSVAPASPCTFTVTFAPTQPGPRFGSILIEDNAAGSPHFISLSGSGAGAVADLTPSSLNFSSLQLNQTSAPQTATLANAGNATLDISNISITGEYGQTNNCPASLGIGANCQFQITFTPTTGGAQNGTLSVTDKAPGSPHTITLSGSGYVTTATFSPSSLTFGSQALGTTSAPQTITITNTGANPMSVSSVVVTTGFAQTNNCLTVPVQSSCTISVTFSPTGGGSVIGAVTINDDAQGNPHTISLSGTGLAGVAQLSTSTLSFEAQSVGTPSLPQSINVTNTGNGSLIFGGIQATGDFAQTNNCSTLSANGGACTIQVTFTPMSSGTRTGTLTLTDSAANSPQSVTLVGGGVDFSMPASGGASTIVSGATGTYQFAISPIGGTFNSAISLTCAGLPAFSTCTIDPKSVTPGANAASVTVNVKTSGNSAQLLAPRNASRPLLAMWSLTSGLGLFGMFLFGPGHGRNRNRRFLLLLGLAACLLFCASCGTIAPASPSQSQNSTPTGTYTVLVIGTSGSAQHFTSLSLTVQ